MLLEENPPAASFENDLFSRWTARRRRLMGGGEKIFAGVYEAQVRVQTVLDCLLSSQNSQLSRRFLWTGKSHRFLFFPHSECK